MSGLALVGLTRCLAERTIPDGNLPAGCNAEGQDGAISVWWVGRYLPYVPIAVGLPPARPEHALLFPTVNLGTYPPVLALGEAAGQPDGLSTAWWSSSARTSGTSVAISGSVSAVFVRVGCETFDGHGYVRADGRQLEATRGFDGKTAPLSATATPRGARNSM